MSKRDPADFLRGLVNDWTTGAQSGATGGFRTIVDQALAAGNIPTRGDLAALEERLSSVEQALARIERRLDDVETKKAKKARKADRPA